MLQLQLSSALDKGRQYHSKVVCFQKTDVGRYVGTMSETEDGYIGQLLMPKHPMLPAAPGGQQLGFLHSNRDEAFEALALHVAKAAWNGSLGFEPTCLDACSRATRDAFVAWLIDKIADSRSTAAHGKPTESTERRATAVRIKAAVAQERAALIQREFLSLQNAGGTLQ
jgi:hypothetical protein